MTVGSAININRAEWTVNPLRENTGRHGTKGSFALTSMKAAIVSLANAAGQNRYRLVVGVTRG
jgi:hypothetical protein